MPRFPCRSASALLPAFIWIASSTAAQAAPARESVRAGAEAPAPRSCFAIAYGPGHGVLVYGGASSCGLSPVDDRRLWAWNGAAWTAVATAPEALGPREDMLMAWDTARGVAVLYGGRRGATVFSDTWEWGAAGWARRATSASPGPIEHAAMAYDPRRRRTVVFGGGHRARSTPFDATWEWDGDRWSERASSDPRPPARLGHAMTWSPELGAIALYGGFGPAGSFRDLWMWNGAWTRIGERGPSTSEGPVMAACRGSLHVLLEPTADGAGHWQFADGVWSAGAAGAPPRRVGQGAACDSARNRFVVWGGHVPDRPAVDEGIREFDGALWSRGESATAPAAQSPAPILQPDAFDVVPLADGVHAVIRRDPPDDAANANVLIIINAGDVVVVDGSLTPSSAGATIAAIRALTPLPVRYVINTHWHDDHVLGNSAYADAFPGVEFIGHPSTRRMVVDSVGPALEQNRVAYAEEATRLEATLAGGVSGSGAPLTDAQRLGLERAIALHRGFLAEIPRMRLTPPSLLVGDELTLVRGERLITIKFLGRGNTEGDLVVHLPREGIVATGDLLVHPIPFAFGSHPKEWAETLERLAALDARIVVPGHGDVQRDATHLTNVRALLADLTRQMQDAVAKGLTLEQARAALDLEAHRKTFAGEDAGRAAAFDYLFVTPASEPAYIEAGGKVDAKGMR